MGKLKPDRTIEDVRRINRECQYRLYNKPPVRQGKIAIDEYLSKKQQYSESMGGNEGLWQAELLEDLLVKIRDIFTGEGEDVIAAKRRSGK